MQDNNFLPKDYSVPETNNSKYMRLEEGENRFRVLSSAIIGWEYWTEDATGRHPNRVRRASDLPEEVVTTTDPKKRVKHFWAFVVFNTKTKDIQILELTQKSIMNSIAALVESEDWGSPMEYDIIINRSGKDLDTQYSVVPTPKKPTDPGVLAFYEDLNINLEALYDGEDPFNSPQDITPEEIEEIAKKL